MDAYVGVDVLGLSFMKGDQPHAGFPEAAYSAMAEKLARAGYRVVVVEQVRCAVLCVLRVLHARAVRAAVLLRAGGCCRGGGGRGGDGFGCWRNAPTIKSTTTTTTTKNP